MKNDFVEWIDEFTDKFVRSLNKIEQQIDLANFVGEDKIQEMRLADLSEKYQTLLDKLSLIRNTNSNEKLT